MTLELKSVAKRVGADVHIHPTSVVFERGKLNVLLGTTLAGKTSLMHLAAGLERPTGGEIWFDGVNVTGIPVRKRNVSMVYQQFINYPNFTVFENIASPLRVARVGEMEIRDRVGTMAELLKLSPMLDRRPSELSGGQQQRTAMARALVKDADLVLLDEPLANLDFKLREELRDELPKLFADRNCVVVYATTEPPEALMLSGMTATMSEGRVTQFGPTGDVYRHPRDLVSARVFSDPPINTVAVQKSGDHIVLGDSIRWPAAGALVDLADGPYVFGVRPHHVAPVPIGPTPVPFEGRVQVTELSGSESVVHMDFLGNSWVCQTHGIHSFEVGAPATLHVDVSRGLYFDADENFVCAGGAASDADSARLDG
ncbi:MAG: ABC transporter ATP-binding protein [Pseudomonadota bacterium]